VITVSGAGRRRFTLRVAVLSLAVLFAGVCTATTPSRATTGSEPLPLGGYEATDAVPETCPSAAFGGPYDCSSFVITGCPDLAEIQGTVAVGEPIGGPIRGVIVFLSGSGGRAWYSNDIGADGLLMDVRSQGFRVIQVRWQSRWLESVAGQQTGAVRLACRPATMISAIHDRYFAPLGLADRTDGVCGFCVTGNSAGSSQVAYGLSSYGLDRILDAAVLTAGPPHAEIARGCLGPKRLRFSRTNAITMDLSYGFAPDQGPCVARDPSWVSRWDQDSFSLAGNDYLHPSSRIAFIIGEADPLMAELSSYYRQRLDASGTPMLTYQVLPAVGHEVPTTELGRTAIFEALVDEDIAPDVTAPVVDLRTPVVEGVYGLGEVVEADFSCADEQGGSGVASCVGSVPDGGSIDTSTVGAHEVSVTATDFTGNTTTVTRGYSVEETSPDVTAPVVDLRVPVVGGVYGLGAVVEADFSCVDEEGGSGVASCVGSVPDGGPIDTSTVGAHKVGVTATDQAGNRTTVTCRYSVQSPVSVSVGDDD
jgi:hypothetical protein